MKASSENKLRSPRQPPRHRWVWGLQSFVVLFAIWIALNGFKDIWLGLAAATIGALLGSWLTSGKPHPWRPHRLLMFALYFLWESLKGGVDVAWRAMHPALRIDPCFTRHVMRLPEGQPRTLLISIVSLLPGTLSASTEEGQVLRVHALTSEASDSVGQLEHWIAWLFSLEGKRDD